MVIFALSPRTYVLGYYRSSLWGWGPLISLFSACDASLLMHSREEAGQQGGCPYAREGARATESSAAIHEADLRGESSCCHFFETLWSSAKTFSISFMRLVIP